MTTFLDSDKLSCAVTDAGWGPVQVVPATGSTNADVATAARTGASAGLVIVTGWQQAGRGRFNRVWQTPPGTCVAMSVLVRPVQPLERWGWLSLLVGLAVTDGVQAASGLAAELKWPNDVLIGGRKICGILSEAVATPDGTAAVLGMGINVALPAEALPVESATSLLIEGAAVSGTDVAASVLGALHGWFERWNAGESLVAAYRERCGTLGRRVRVLIPGGAVEGEAINVDADGSLVVRTASGTRTFAAGDVVHLRPGE